MFDQPCSLLKLVLTHDDGFNSLFTPFAVSVSYNHGNPGNMGFKTSFYILTIFFYKENPPSMKLDDKDLLSTIEEFFKPSVFKKMTAYEKKNLQSRRLNFEFLKKAGKIYFCIFSKF